MVKVSVIIPIYNNEKYIKQCVESVLEQTLKEIEVICIDDGSMDNSAKIVKSIMLMEERIVLLQQANQGPGIARNLGIKKAKGKYVVFLDADDYYLDKDALEKMYNSCETCDVFVCACLNWCINDKIVRTEKLELLDKNQIKNEIFYYKDYQMDYNFINYLFLREFLLENDLFFPQYRRFEDPPFLVNILYHAVRFAVVDACLYYYRSPVLEARFDLKKTIELLQGLIDNLIFSKKYHLNILYETTLWRIEHEYIDIITRNIESNDGTILKLLIKIYSIVNSENKSGDYVIRPLRRLLLYQCEKNLLRKIEKQDNIALYGAGKLGKAFYLYLEKNGLNNRIVNFFVSNLQGEYRFVYNVPVLEIQPNMCKGNIFIYVTAGNGFQKEIEKYLLEKGFNNYEIIDEELLNIIAEDAEQFKKIF